MTILKVSEDGRIALPKEMRASLSLGSGDEVEASIEGNSIRLVRARAPKQKPRRGIDISAWIGAGRSFASQEEVDAFIRAERDSWD